MILVKVDEKDIKRIKPHSDLYKLLDEFITGGMIARKYTARPSIIQIQTRAKPQLQAR